MAHEANAGDEVRDILIEEYGIQKSQIVKEVTYRLGKKLRRADLVVKCSDHQASIETKKNGKSLDDSAVIQQAIDNAVGTKSDVAYSSNGEEWRAYDPVTGDPWMYNGQPVDYFMPKLLPNGGPALVTVATEEGARRVLSYISNICREAGIEVGQPRVQAICDLFFLKQLPDLSEFSTGSKPLPQYAHLSNLLKVKDDDTFMAHIDNTFEHLQKRSSSWQKIFATGLDPKLKASHLREIFKLLESIDFNTLEVHKAGLVYEKVISEVMAGNGQGQYFTPRNYTNYGLSRLGIKAHHKVSDPFSGTGGFLTGLWDRMLADLGPNPTTQQVQALRKQVYGFDKSEFAVRIARQSLIIHGDGHSNVHQMDTFRCEDVINQTTMSQFDPRNLCIDRISTNGPWGIPAMKDILADIQKGAKEDAQKRKAQRAGIPYTPQYTRKYPWFRIEQSKAEGLAIEWCGRALAPNGMAYMVVPLGVLFADNYKTIREWLINNFNILEVGTFPITGFQPYANVKAGWILFEKRGKTSHIEYYHWNEITGAPDHVGQISPFELVTQAGKQVQKLTNSSLFWQDHNPEVLKSSLSNTTNYRLGDLFEVIPSDIGSGNIVTPALGEDVYPFYTGVVDNPVGDHDGSIPDKVNKRTGKITPGKNGIVTGECLILIKGGGSPTNPYGASVGLGKAFYIPDGQAVAYSDGCFALKPKAKDFEVGYVGHLINANKKFFVDIARGTTGLSSIGKKVLENIEIPLPPLADQKKRLAQGNQAAAKIRQLLQDAEDETEAQFDIFR